MVGFGAWGKNLARNFSDLGSLKVICDLDTARLESAKKEYPNIDTRISIDQLIERTDIDAVVIAGPSSEHVNLGRKALSSGKHVLIEKPLALRVSEGIELNEMAKQEKKILMVGHVMEYHPAVIKLRELIEAGSLGRVEYIYSHRLNFGRIRTEENALWSFAPHDIAILLRLLKSPPDSVACSGGAYVNHRIADTTMTTLTFRDGVKAHIFVSWLHPFKVQRLVLVGERQMAVFDDTKPWTEKLLLYPHRVDWIDGQIPVAREAKAIPVSLEEKEPLKVECEHFLQCIASRTEPLTNGESAVRVLEVLDAAERSLECGGEPISMNGTVNNTKPYFVHPSAFIDEGVEIGKGTKIWHYSHVMPGAKIGRNCILGQNVFVGKNVSIGEGVKIQNNVSVYEGVTLENFVFCGPGVNFTNVINPRSAVERKNEFKKTRVEHDATLGAGSTIICGVSVGPYAFVGAGAVVTKEVPAYALVLGVPGRVTGWMCECGDRLKFLRGKAVCSVCEKRYRQVNRSVERE